MVMKGKLIYVDRDGTVTRKPRLGRSRTGAGVGYRGPVHPWVWLVLTRCWHDGLRIESNYAREKRWAVSFSASVGWISVVSPDGMSYGRTWRITAEGLTVLSHHNHGEA